MNDVAKGQDLFVQSVAVYSEAYQQVLQHLVEFGCAGAREAVRLSADLQRHVLEGLRQAQGAALRWPGLWREAAGDPTGWWQKTLHEAINSAQEAARLAEEQARSVSRTAERLQATAEQAGKGIQETLIGAVTKMTALCAGR